jgi:predicted PurR-regulated permease PerM
MPLLDRPAARDIPRILFVVLSIGGLIAASFWIMKPFLGAIVWAAMFAIATWPLLVSLDARFGGRRAPAVAVMLLALLAVLVVPTWLAVSTIADNADRLGELVRSVLREGLPPPPPWLEHVPVVGTPIAERWQEAADPESLAARLAPHLRDARDVGRVARGGGRLRVPPVPPHRAHLRHLLRVG